jgi:tripartite-type tricarboxylate transporter receptor subunit TctC
MKGRRFLTFALAVIAAASVLSSAALAQVGEQPIRIIFPFAAGGSGDALARLIAEKMQAGLNRNVIVESRTGGAGRVGMLAVKNAAPDGTTLLITPIAPMSVYQHTYKSLDYDPINDFASVSQVATFDFGIAVNAELEVHSLKELVAWCRANPAKANFGIPATGSLPHFLGILFGRAAGIDLKQVAYRGSAAALTDMIAGHIPMMVTTTSDLAQMHKAGRIRMLATSDKQRSPFVPEVPTFREAGYEIEATSWYGMFAPAKTPSDVIERYSKVIAAAVQAPDVKAKLLAFGMNPTGTTAAELAKIQKDDAALWGPAVRASGFTAQP